LAAFGNFDHVLTSSFQRLDDRGGRLGFGQSRIRRFSYSLYDALNVILDRICVLLNLPCGFVGRFRERTDLIRDDGESPPMVARSRRFYRSVQSQEIRLIRNLAYRLRDFANVFRPSFELGDNANRFSLAFRIALDRAR
jgi:hypothetical protein